MPTYEYACEKCGQGFEEERPITQGPRSRCPQCKAKAPAFHQIYGAPTIWCYNVTTFGQQAERNAKRLGKEALGLQEEADRNRYKKATGKLPKGAKALEIPKDKPWWRKGDKPLDLRKVRDPQKYIETGKKT